MVCFVHTGLEFGLGKKKLIFFSLLLVSLYKKCGVHDIGTALLDLRSVHRSTARDVTWHENDFLNQEKIEI